MTSREVTAPAREGHTPAPWALVADRSSAIGVARGWEVTADDGTYQIASINNFGEYNNEANARLIAAAPAMYEALRVSEIVLHSMHGYFSDSNFNDRYGDLPRIKRVLEEARAALASATQPQGE